MTTTVGVLGLGGRFASIARSCRREAPNVIWLVIDRSARIASAASATRATPAPSSTAGLAKRLPSRLLAESYTIASVASFFTSTPWTIASSTAPDRRSRLGFGLAGCCATQLPDRRIRLRPPEALQLRAGLRRDDRKQILRELEPGPAFETRDGSSKTEAPPNT
jgi:hypothetical protein